MSTSFFAKLTAMITSELLPCRAGSARKLGESMMVNSGARGDGGRGVVDEQVAAEEIVPGELVDDPHRQAIDRIRAGETVEHEQLLAGQRREKILVEGVELSRRPSAG